MSIYVNFLCLAFKRIGKAGDYLALQLGGDRLNMLADTLTLNMSQLPCEIFFAHLVAADFYFSRLHKCVRGNEHGFYHLVKVGIFKRAVKCGEYALKACARETALNRDYKYRLAIRTRNKADGIAIRHLDKRLKQSGVEVFTARTDDKVIHAPLVIISCIANADKVAGVKPLVVVCHSNVFALHNSCRACFAFDQQLAALVAAIFGIAKGRSHGSCVKPARAVDGYLGDTVVKFEHGRVQRAAARDEKLNTVAEKAVAHLAECRLGKGLAKTAQTV